MNNTQFVTASLSEFISVWNHGGDASLNLTTSGSFIDISFNLLLGQLGTPFPNSPSSTPPMVGRHRGPAQKERDRQRAARHQATKTGRPTPTTATPVTSTPTTEPVSESLPVSATAPGFTTAMAYLAWIALIVPTSLSSTCHCSVSILCPPHLPKLTVKTILNVLYFSSHQNYPEMHRLDT